MEELIIFDDEFEDFMRWVKRKKIKILKKIKIEDVYIIHLGG